MSVNFGLLENISLNHTSSARGKHKLNTSKQVLIYVINLSNYNKAKSIEEH